MLYVGGADDENLLLANLQDESIPDVQCHSIGQTKRARVIPFLFNPAINRSLQAKGLKPLVQRIFIEKWYNLRICKFRKILKRASEII